MVVVLILLSQFKQDILIMSANFVDVMLIDADTISFLLTVFPDLRWTVAVATAGSSCRCSCLFWWLDPFRVRLRVAALGAVGCLAALTGLSIAQCRWTARRRSSRPTTSRSSRAQARSRCSISPRAAFSNRDSTAHDRLSAGSARGLQAGAAAAAHRARAGRVELRHQRGAGRQGARWLSKPLPFVRWQGAHVPGRRRGRADLVHRIQCAERTCRRARTAISPSS